MDEVEQAVASMAAWVQAHGIERGVERLEGERGFINAFALAEALAEAGADEARVYGMLFFGEH
jgi:hypothetical protein